MRSITKGQVGHVSQRTHARSLAWIKRILQYRFEFSRVSTGIDSRPQQVKSIGGVGCAYSKRNDGQQQGLSHLFNPASY
jgi:hypothetical protein